jgi:hypothetical protein
VVYLPPGFEVGIRIDDLLFLLRGQEVSQGDPGHGQPLYNTERKIFLIVVILSISCTVDFDFE